MDDSRTQLSVSRSHGDYDHLPPSGPTGGFDHAWQITTRKDEQVKTWKLTVRRAGTTFEVMACAVLLLLMIAVTVGGSCGKQNSSGSHDKATESSSSSSGSSGKTGTTTTASTGAGDPEAGRKIFMTTCIACHTETGGSRPNLGKDIAHSEWVKSQTDEQLIAFLKKGRDTSDPLNTTGVAMPPRGGNPSITDDQLKDIVALIREFQKNAG